MCSGKTRCLLWDECVAVLGRVRPVGEMLPDAMASLEFQVLVG